MGYGRTIYFSDENMVYLIKLGKGTSKLSNIVNNIIDRQRLSDNNVLTPQTEKLLEDYINTMTVSGIIVERKQIINRAIQEYIQKTNPIVTMSPNTGFD